MTNESRYYKEIVKKIDLVLRESKNSPYINRMCIVEGQDKHTYTIECEGNPYFNTQKNNLLVQDKFLKDLKECLVNDKPFQLLFNKNEELLSDFFNKIKEYLYIMNDRRHYTHPDDFIIPTSTEFENILKCFEPTLTSIDIIVRGIPRYYAKSNKDYISLIPIVLSLHNASFYSNKNTSQLKKIIKNELDTLTVLFAAEEEPLIAEGIKQYLKKKKSLLIKINDNDFENSLYEIVQSVVHSDFWADIASNLPSFSKKKKLAIDTNIFANEGHPIFHINLNKENIFNISPAIISEKDFEKMLKETVTAIGETKPGSIEFVQVIKTSNDVKLIVAGKDMNNELLLKIGRLFESMIYEYNSTNVSKKNDDDETDEEKKNNSEYLRKAAEVLWLNIELGQTNSKQKNKTTKI
jgi:predicted transcriptional regulator